MQPRYSPLNQFPHWITALCMLGLLPLAWVMVNAKHGAPHVEDLFNWHKTLGVIVLIVTAVRIVWRLRDPPPPYPPSVASWERRVAHAIYWLFLATLIWMPVTGILGSTFGGHAIKLFDAVPTPLLLAKDKRLADLQSAAPAGPMGRLCADRAASERGRHPSDLAQGRPAGAHAPGERRRARCAGPARAAPWRARHRRPPVR